MKKNIIIVREEIEEPLLCISIKDETLKDANDSPEKWAKLLDYLKDKFEFYVTEGNLYGLSDADYTVKLDRYLLSMLLGTKCLDGYLYRNVYIHSEHDGGNKCWNMYLKKKTFKDKYINKEEYTC